MKVSSVLIGASILFNVLLDHASFWTKTSFVVALVIVFIIWLTATVSTLKRLTPGSFVRDEKTGFVAARNYTDVSRGLDPHLLLRSIHRLEVATKIVMPILFGVTLLASPYVYFVDVPPYLPAMLILAVGLIILWATFYHILKVYRKEKVARKL